MSKMKITIEHEGHPTQVIEAHGLAAALLTDGNDSDHYGLKVCICGQMSNQDLLHLTEGVEEELTEALRRQLVDKAIKGMSASDLLKILLGGDKHGTDR